jgi:hypothetical protein
MLKTGAAKTADFATGLDARREVGRTAMVSCGPPRRVGRADFALRVEDHQPDEARCNAGEATAGVDAPGRMLRRRCDRRHQRHGGDEWDRDSHRVG